DWPRLPTGCSIRCFWSSGASRSRSSGGRGGIVRIALVTATFPPYLAGTGNVCYHNALGLAAAGHDVTVFTAGYPPVGQTDPEGVTVRRLPVVFRLGNAPVLPGLLGMGRFDLVHLHYPFYFGSEMVLLKSLVNHVPYVVTYHQDVLLGGLL